MKIDPQFSSHWRTYVLQSVYASIAVFLLRSYWVWNMQCDCLALEQHRSLYLQCRIIYPDNQSGLLVGICLDFLWDHVLLFFH